MAKKGMYGVFYAKAVLTDGVVTGYTGGVKMMGQAISAEFTPIRRRGIPSTPTTAWRRAKPPARPAER